MNDRTEPSEPRRAKAAEKNECQEINSLFLVFVLEAKT
jgi:hypothetical protein